MKLNESIDYTEENDYSDDGDDDNDMIGFYSTVVPCLISLAMFSFILNILILISILSSKHLIRSMLVRSGGFN